MAMIADMQAGNSLKTSSQKRQTSASEHSRAITTVLTEDMVTDSLKSYLETNGWRITSRAPGKKRGIDLVAERAGTRLEVEAKGAGCSGPRPAGYGQEFSSTQVFTHVGEALLKVLQSVSADRAQAAIAFPDNHHHRLQVERIRVALQRLGIIVFWVREDGAVTMEGDFHTKGAPIRTD
jgi:hypothetical protein